MKPPRLDAVTVAPLLRTRWLGRTWHWKRTTASTNDDLKRLAEHGAPAGTVLTADRQTGGRGRAGRHWHSPQGGLWMSVLLRPRVPAAALAPLGLAVAVAVGEAVAEHGGNRVELKWPNDVLVDGRKLAGILAEAAVEGGRVRHVVVGIGVNLNVARFPAPLRKSAMSLHRVRGGSVDRGVFATDLCAHLERWIECFEHEGSAPVVEAWKARGRLGRPVRLSCASAVLEGVAEDLESDGALRLRLADGRVERVLSGEIE